MNDVRECNLSMIKHAILKSPEAFKTIDMEFQLLAYRDSLPPDQRHVQSRPDEPKKPIQMFHIPKGALDDKPYMFGNEQAQPSGNGIVQSF